MSNMENDEKETNYYEILLALTTRDTEEINNFDDKLQQILYKTLPMLSEDFRNLIIKQNENENDILNVRCQYLHTIINVLQRIQSFNLKCTSTYINVNQFRTIKIAIELITSIGIMPCLLPGVGVDMVKLCSRVSQLCQVEITDLQKYKLLSTSAKSLVELFNDDTFKPAILSQLGSLLAALLQLSHAPLMKPSNKLLDHNNVNERKFIMTADLYKELKKDQEEFHSKLVSILDNVPQPTIIKELMVIHGLKGAPKWLRKETQNYLINRIMQQNGIISLITAVCDDILDLGEHWNKLETVSKLIATTHGSDSNQYYGTVCSQILDLLSSRKIKYSSEIANYCITALYEVNPDVCVKNIVEVMATPLLIKQSKETQLSIIQSEGDVENCIENLTKTFVTTEAKFKYLPCKLLSMVAAPLFSIYVKINQSACALKIKVKQLLLSVLQEETLQESLFSLYLGHSVTEMFGQHVLSQFGPTGGIEIIGIEKSPNYEEYADSLFDLTSADSILSTSLFSYLLKFVVNLNKKKCDNSKKILLETEDDIISRIEEQLIAVKVLSNLANTTTVQEAQINNPLPLFTFIKALFSDYLKQDQIFAEDDFEILYISLMLIKIIINDRKKPADWDPFKDFAQYLKEHCSVTQMPSQLLTLIQEIINLIEKQYYSEQRYYHDLSVDQTLSHKFDEAIKDLSDPLLPVRAHGLIALTKLIDTKDLYTITRKAILVRLFQENLKHEDSFIYLASINGLCALATLDPQAVISTLIQEFIDMPQRLTNNVINAETRMKLGEILVKTTRALGEMASAYKNILINGFLCATRDPDPLVRASSLSCLGELCKVLGYKLGSVVIEVMYCISCIIQTDKVPECRRAAVLVATLLLRGVGKDVLTTLDSDLVGLYRGLKHLYNNDDDPVLRLHAQLALEEIDDIVQGLLFSKPKLEKTIFLLDPLT